MSALKRKDLSALESAQTNALPMDMLHLERTGQLHLLPAAKLTPAPAGWNFYRPLPEGKLLELIASIEEKGLLHPVVVWRREQDYLILSGHNRVEAFKRLYNATGDGKYERVPCVVREDLTEQEAREIIVDSNWVQRALTPRERVLSISAKYAAMGRKKRAASASERGRGYDVIARQYGLSGRQVARYVQLGNLCEPLLRAFDEGKLGVRAACWYAGCPQEVQHALAKRYDPLPDAKKVCSLRHDLPLEELFAALDAPQEELVTVSFTVPADKKERLEAMVAALLRKKE